MANMRECGFDRRKQGCATDCRSCPAEQAVQLCNAIQVRFSGKDYADIRKEFSAELQKRLEVKYPCLVVWTPDKEKVGLESPDFQRLRRQDWYARTPFHEAVNDAIIVLNKKYYSHNFLRKLITLTRTAKSRVFRLEAATDHICFQTLFPEMPEKQGQGLENYVITQNIAYPDSGSPAQFLERLHAGNFAHAGLGQQITDYIGKWQAPDIRPAVEKAVYLDQSSAEEKIEESDDEPIAPSNRDYAELAGLWADSVKHMALMFLFAELNGYTGATYYLSPLDRNTLKSSMIIYWKKDEPSTYQHYLIQMLLGLNAAPMLLQREEIKQKDQLLEARKMALGHYGHTLKHRLDTLSAYLDAQDLPPAIRMRKEMLSDLTLILQLHVIDSREELENNLPERKRNRFFDVEREKGVEKQLDLVKKINEWSVLFSGPKELRIIDPERNVNQDLKCPFELRIGTRIKRALIGFPMTLRIDHGKYRARMKEAVYREVIFELLNNAVRYGSYHFFRDKNEGYKSFLRLAIAKQSIRIKKSIVDLLVISNSVQPVKASQDQFILDALNFDGWIRWPEAKQYDGPGMAVALLRRLRLGDMYFRIQERQGIVVFRVGLQFEGMEISS